MTEETLRRLEPKFSRVIDLFCSMSGADSFQAAIAALGEPFRDANTSPAPWLHKVARELISKLFPTAEQDSVRPEYFYEILGLIDTEEKFNATLASLPEEASPQIETFLDFLVKDFLPSQRSAAENLAKRLPRRRAGGRPSTSDDEAECVKICDAIQRLERAGVSRGTAQKQVAAKTGKSLRTVQRIWGKRANDIDNSEASRPATNDRIDA